MLERLLLVELDRAGRPLGGEVLQRLAAERGAEASVSTVARRLRRLDQLGLTEAALTDGRVLTREGARLVASTLRVERAASLLAEASELSTDAQLHDQLVARLAVEPAAAADAARHRSRLALEELEHSLAVHTDALEYGTELPRGATLRFHRLISAACDNALLRSMVAVVLDGSLDPLQSELDRVIRVRDSDEQGLHDHSRILDAVRKGDGPAAQEAMRAHLQRLVEELERYRNS